METAKTPFHDNHNQKNKFLYSFHKTKYNKYLLKKLGQMEKHFSRKYVANCQIRYFEKIKV